MYTVLEFDKKRNAVLIKETMGSHQVQDKQGKNHSVWAQWYKIDPKRDTFYERRQDCIVED